MLDLWPLAAGSFIVIIVLKWNRRVEYARRIKENYN